MLGWQQPHRLEPHPDDNLALARREQTRQHVPKASKRKATKLRDIFLSDHKVKIKLGKSKISI
jgi:hypothetical protein